MDMRILNAVEDIFVKHVNMAANDADWGNARFEGIDEYRVEWIDIVVDTESKPVKRNVEFPSGGMLTDYENGTDVERVIPIDARDIKIFKRNIIKAMDSETLKLARNITIKASYKQAFSAEIRAIEERVNITENESYDEVSTEETIHVVATQIVVPPQSILTVGKIPVIQEIEFQCRGEACVNPIVSFTMGLSNKTLSYALDQIVPSDKNRIVRIDGSMALQTITRTRDVFEIKPFVAGLG